MNLKLAFSNMFRLLSFRITREEMMNFNKTDLYLGVFSTWIVGIGRYWDDPGAKLLQYLGVGSVAYIFVLSFFIWFLFWPFKIKNWNYTNLLTFTSLTSLPAILYAIPVERFLSMDLSAKINAYFLLTVAVWRVVLLVFYLRRYANLTIFETCVATLLPLTAIVSSLTVLNLERAVFNIMGGIREKTSGDSAYAILNFLTFFSVLLIAPVLISYIVIIYRKYKHKA